MFSAYSLELTFGDSIPGMSWVKRLDCMSFLRTGEDVLTEKCDKRYSRLWQECDDYSENDLAHASSQEAEQKLNQFDSGSGVNTKNMMEEGCEGRAREEERARREESRFRMNKKEWEEGAEMKWIIRSDKGIHYTMIVRMVERMETEWRDDGNVAAPATRIVLFLRTDLSVFWSVRFLPPELSAKT